VALEKPLVALTPGATRPTIQKGVIRSDTSGPLIPFLIDAVVVCGAASCPSHPVSFYRLLTHPPSKTTQLLTPAQINLLLNIITNSHSFKNYHYQLQEDKKDQKTKNHKKKLKASP
jgi:hypothetical protein